MVGMSTGMTAAAPDVPTATPPTKTPSGYLYWVAKVVLTPILTVAFRPHVEGASRVPKRGAAVLACNHVSYLDWMFLALVVPFRRINFLAKMEYFTGTGVKGRLRRFFFTATGQVPVDRGGADAAAAALTTAVRLLDEKRLVGFFPEGTRSRDGRLNRGRTGLARVAAASGVAVIPCATVGVYEVCPAGKRLPRPRKVGIRFGEPMTFPGAPTTAATPAELRTWTDQLMDRIQALSGQEQSGVDAVGGRS
ncbi:MAG: phospholipid/glycerol acyltransferase [Frankiales bacterium]|nr:phospholipid/glycerol acyltransferase [Frankiales bacterium]